MGPHDVADALARAEALVDAMEAALTPEERKRGAHYTPRALADEVAALALPSRSCGVSRRETAAEDARTRVRVVDPACGAGAILLAAGRRLVELGLARDDVARDLLWGADIDARAVAVCEAAIAEWSGGTAPAPGHVVTADALALGRGAWPGLPADGFAAVVGNPPFQGQLASQTARDEQARAQVAARFGAPGRGYVDTAALFLLLGVELLAPGRRVAMVQPQSVVAARDAGPVRAALADRARLVALHVPTDRPFGGRVHVCVPVLEVGSTGPTDWAAALADGRGVPDVRLPDGPTLSSRADVVAGFRQHYYGLVGHVHDDGPGAPLVTSGALGVGTCRWGSEPVRFAKRRWARPVVDLAAVRRTVPRLERWLDQVLRPKVVVATQTRVVEAAADHAGTWVPCTPAISVVPHDPAAVDLLAAALCAPPVSAWAARRAAGTGLSPTALRLSAPLLAEVPLPTDEGAWSVASAALRAGDLGPFAERATAMYRLDPRAAQASLDWWRNIHLGPPRGVR